MDTTKVYELACSVIVVMNCLLYTVDHVRFGLLRNYDDVCIYAPCHCYVIFCYTLLIFTEESTAEPCVVTWNSSHSVIPYNEITLN
jgi:hypothetical protein